MKKKQRRVRDDISRALLGVAAEEALSNYIMSGMVMPGDTMISVVAWRVKGRAWDGEPVRSR